MAVGSFKLPIGNSTITSDDWVRPSDWLTMPTIGTQEFIGLLAVTDDDSNHISLLFRGAYTVDWGDGVIENVADNVKASHSYTYSSISSGTLCSRGYKQVLVRVTPQVGQNITVINLQQQNSIIGKVHTTGWLDMAIKGANITTLTLGGTTVYQSMCENVDIYSLGSITSLGSAFENFYQLRKFTINNTSLVISLNNTFKACYSLKTIPFFNTSSVTSLSGTWQNCYSLRTMPLLDFSKVTSTDTTWSGCSSMQFYPLFDFSKVTTFSGTFLYNTSLQQFPNCNLALVTSFGGGGFNAGCVSVARGAFQNIRYSISYANFSYSQSAIVEIFNGLGTAVGTPTVNVSSNPGRAALTAAEILIATSKGWIVV